MKLKLTPLQILQADKVIHRLSKAKTKETMESYVPTNKEFAKVVATRAITNNIKNPKVSFRYVSLAFQKVLSKEESVAIGLDWVHRI